MDDYDNVPIEQYGLAMLRGMGWKPGTFKFSALRLMCSCGEVQSSSGAVLFSNGAVQSSNSVVQSSNSAVLREAWMVNPTFQARVSVATRRLWWRFWTP